MKMFAENNDNVDEADERIPFVGRRRELEEIKAWCRLSRQRLVQIYGPPFTGKQRLANQIQNELVAEYEEKQMPLKCINTSGECLTDWNVQELHSHMKTLNIALSLTSD
ncbi:uncharacterized protein LOC110460816 [Mizuhopecten yessoensis]|uniref:uncharacterized protein LOC110460816 n=1 Tax=Mizuhopecten yessoensis TaxID=6573 RepID=UPI000B45C694|nr:uncharacterized protein LOC110460816 [Mizuhopecten yessoensis]